MVEYEIDLFFASLFYNAGLTFHTPIGAYSIFIGLGGGYMHVEDSVRKFDRGMMIMNFGFSYVAFMTQNLFFITSVESSSPNATDPIPNPYVKFDGWFSTSAGIGYFLPELRGQIRDLLPF